MILVGTDLNLRSIFIARINNGGFCIYAQTVKTRMELITSVPCWARLQRGLIQLGFFESEILWAKHKLDKES